MSLLCIYSCNFLCCRHLLVTGDIWWDLERKWACVWDHRSLCRVILYVIMIACICLPAASLEVPGWQHNHWSCCTVCINLLIVWVTAVVRGVDGQTYPWKEATEFFSISVQNQLKLNLRGRFLPMEKYMHLQQPVRLKMLKPKRKSARFFTK